MAVPEGKTFLEDVRHGAGKSTAGAGDLNKTAQDMAMRNVVVEWPKAARRNFILQESPAPPCPNDEGRRVGHAAP